MGKTKQDNKTLDLKLGFVTLIAIFVVFGVFVLYEMQRVADLNRTIYDHPLVVSNAALQANTSIAKMHRNMKDVVLFNSLSRVQESIKAVDEEEKEGYRHLNTVRDNILGEQGKILEEEARQLFDDWRIIRSEVIDSVKSNHRNIAAEITIGKGAHHVALLEEKMLGLTNYARNKASIFVEDTQKVQSRLTVTSIFFLIVGTLLSILVAFVTLKRNYLASQNLLESEARYRSLIENQTDLVCRFTPDGQFNFVNDIYCQFFSMPKEELIGSKWQPLPVDDDVELINKKLSTLSQKNPTVEIENRVRSGKGEIHWMHFSNSGIFDSQGNLLEIQSVGRDITGQKKSKEALLKSEARYARAVRGTTDGLWDWNIVTNEDYHSPRWNELLGFAETEIANDHDASLSRLHPDDVSRVQEAMNGHLEKCLPYNIKHRLQTKSGDYKWFHVRGMAERDEQGRPLIMSGSITDITELMKTEAEKEKLELELRQKHKMGAVGYMAGGMAHNFNNNLSIILGNVELSQMKLPKDSEIVPLLENAKIAVRRSRDLVLKIITYSRKGMQSTIVTQLTPIIKETSSLLQSTLPTTIRLQQNINPDCSSVLVDADPSQIQEILVNLCNNAVHAMDEKGELQISLEPVELREKDIPAQYDATPGFYAKLSVQDTGCGMPNEMLDKIFDPFYTTKEDYEGAGMGLSTVQCVFQ